MSKHQGSVVSPDSVLKEFGADVVRIHILRIARPSKNVEWVDSSISNARRFVEEVWGLIAPRSDSIRLTLANEHPRANADGKLCRLARRTARRVTAFIERYQMSGCIEELQLLTTHIAEFVAEKGLRCEETPSPYIGDERQFAIAARDLILLMLPFCPYIAEELWERIVEDGFACQGEWPNKASSDKAAEVSTARRRIKSSSS